MSNKNWAQKRENIISSPCSILQILECLRYQISLKFPNFQISENFRILGVSVFVAVNFRDQISLTLRIYWKCWHDGKGKVNFRRKSVPRKVKSNNNSGTEVLGFHAFRSLSRQFPCRHFPYILSVSWRRFAFFVGDFKRTPKVPGNCRGKFGGNLKAQTPYYGQNLSCPTTSISCDLAIDQNKYFNSLWKRWSNADRKNTISILIQYENPQKIR